MTVRFKSLHPEFKLPRYATPGAAAFDFHAVEAVRATPGVVTKVPLGCAVQLEPSQALLITARSGHGAKFGAGVPHGYGLIDSDYRGELFMVFVTEYAFDWEAGDRIAQGLVVPAVQQVLEVGDELSPTLRGDGGFGSTGSK